MTKEPPTEAEVERAARAIAEQADNLNSYDNLAPRALGEEGLREIYRRRARAALTAMPSTLGVDVEALTTQDVRRWLQANGMTGIQLIEDVDAHIAALDSTPTPAGEDVLREALKACGTALDDYIKATGKRRVDGFHEVAMMPKDQVQAAMQANNTAAELLAALASTQSTEGEKGC